MLSWLPSWDSLSELEHYQQTLGRVTIWVPAIVGAASLLFAAGWATYNAKVASRIDELRKKQSPATIGELLPGDNENLVFPSLPKQFLAEVAASQFHVFLGNNVFCVNKFPFTIFRQRKESMIILYKDGDKITFSAKFFNREGKAICEIVGNQFRLNYNNIFRTERPSPSHLIVVDDALENTLEIKYLNPHAVEIVGGFFLRDGVRINIDDENLSLQDSTGGKTILAKPTVFLGKEGDYAISFDLLGKQHSVAFNGGVFQKQSIILNRGQGQ
jgi:hypothetical protein